MDDLLFSVPWYLVGLLIVAGAAVFMWGNNRLDRRAKSVGLGLVALAVVWAAVSYVIDTPKEKVVGATRAFVQAVVAQDRAKIESLLDEEVSAGNWGKEEIVNGAVHYAKLTGLTGARIVGMDVQAEGNVLATYPAVWSDHKGGELPVGNLNSRWKLVWQKTGGQWLLREIIPLLIGQTDRDAVEAQYLNRPVKP